MKQRLKSSHTAFTLAEVLIVLTIIGIIAAMTIPTLMSNIEQEKRTSYLKKAHSVLNQVTKLSTVDNGDYADWDTSLSHKDYINKYFAPYMKVAKFCETPGVCGYKSATAWSANLGSYYTGFNYRGRVPIITTDGILYSIVIVGDAAESDEIYDYSAISSSLVIVDVNGPNKPNKFGSDVFMFTRNSDGFVMPMGYNLTDEIIKQDCTTTGRGLYCAEYLRRNNWKAPNGYPW